MLQIEGIRKEFTGGAVPVVALEAVDLAIERGEFVTLVGPSGCGKSSLLTLISGLARAVVRAHPHRRPRHRRNRPRRSASSPSRTICFPWRTLVDNVALSLELAGVGAAERRREAARWIKRVGLDGFEQAYPHQLSGGMRQRANIIRTLIYEPSVILMDEPFGPLDAQTRLSLQALLLSIWETQRSTVLFVTHDLTEAIALADRVVLMSARPGRIVRVDRVEIPRPRDIFYMHDLPEFRRLYDALWHELAAQLDDLRRHTH